jgi:hypothetical protein
MVDRVSKMAANYEAKLRLRVAGPLLEVEIMDRVERYRLKMVEQDRTVQAVKSVLNCSGIPTIMNPHYHAFSREVGKQARREDVSGDSLAREVQIILCKWVARGLVQAVLADIRSQVFNIPAPTPPGA